MKASVQHIQYGEIVYEESFWTGKKNLIVNGVPLEKQDKKTYILNSDGENKLCNLNGNFVTGTKLTIGLEDIELTPAAKWYEIACSVFIFMLILVWGNSVALCSIIPIVGGAIGGGISGLMAFSNLIMMKNQKRIEIKLAIWLGMLLATFLICFVLGLLLIAMLV